MTSHVIDPGHPLVEGLPAQFDLTEAEREYAYFEGYSGETVVELTSDLHAGVGTAAYNGRTSRSVDVLLSTLNFGFYGSPGYGDVPADHYTPEAERLFRNALSYSLDAPPLAAEVRGALLDTADQPLSGQITLVQTGESYPAREGDGTFVVPLQPGTWTLEGSAFGYDPATVEVTVAAGDVVEQDITLTLGPAGRLVGTVTDVGGTGIEGASVVVLGTDLTATADIDGNWTIEGVPAGDWTIRLTAAGYRAEARAVIVTDGVTTEVDVTLEDSNLVAVAGDSGTLIQDLLTGEGYEVDLHAGNALDDITASIGDYALVILNGQGLTPSEASFTGLVDAEADANVSIVFAGQYFGGSIADASTYLGDPTGTDWGFTSSGSIICCCRPAL